MFESLVDKLKNAPDFCDRRQAATELGTLRDARAVEPLIQALTDGDRSVRGMAAEALGALGDARAVEPLVRALVDDYRSVRMRAAKSLSG